MHCFKLRLNDKENLAIPILETEKLQPEINSWVICFILMWQHLFFCILNHTVL